MLIEVTEPSDVRLADYVSLRDSQLRRRIEIDRGLFIAEGDKIIRRACEAGCVPRSFLLQERWLAGLADLLDTWSEVPCYLVSGKLAEQVSGFHVHRGALGSFQRPIEASWEQLLQGRRLLVCEGIVDHTNAGAIMRVAAALGWDGVVISATGADPLYRRSIKASMGASLSIPWRRMNDDADLERIKAAGFTLVATTLSPDAIALAELAAPKKIALMLGSEGHGLSPQWQAAADLKVTIEMAAGIDSLNVATAAAICGYVLR